MTTTFKHFNQIRYETFFKLNQEWNWTDFFLNNYIWYITDIRNVKRTKTNQLALSLSWSWSFSTALSKRTALCFWARVAFLRASFSWSAFSFTCDIWLFRCSISSFRSVTVCSRPYQKMIENYCYVHKSTFYRESKFNFVALINK